jgi:YggT family protein
VIGVVSVLDTLIVVLRQAFFAIAVVLLVVFAADWMVRTRRINPFNPVARFFRRAVQPFILPVERRVVRAGGLPTSAPWWALVAAVVAGIAVLLALDFIRRLLLESAQAASLGPRGVYVLLVSWTFGILQAAVLVRVVASWFRLSPYSRWIRWAVVLTEPILRPLRSIIPPLGMVDVSPIVAWFLLRLIEGFLLSIR